MFSKSTFMAEVNRFREKCAQAFSTFSSINIASLDLWLIIVQIIFTMFMVLLCFKLYGEKKQQKQQKLETSRIRLDKKN